MSRCVTTIVAILAVAAAATSAVAAQHKAPIRAIDWAAVPEAKTVLFFPGQSSLEWTMSAGEHRGSRQIKNGERCAGCHSEEGVTMGARMIGRSRGEPSFTPGKRPSIPLQIKAAFDDDNLYMRFEFPAGPHVDVPFAAGGKMDPANELKLAMMLDQGKVDMAGRAGCWVACHSDARDMPTAPPAAAVKGGYVTKYLPQTRTQFDIVSRDNWDKLKPAEDIAAMLERGAVLDLARWKSSGAAERGYLLADRVLMPSDSVAFDGARRGDAWVVVMQRRLKGEAPGEITLEPGKSYTVGFALHDDFAAGRFHHVSLEMKLGLGGAGDIKAIKQ